MSYNEGNAALNWDEIDLPPETVDEAAATAAENMGKTPVGKFLCTCIDSKPVEKKFKAYSGYAANLKWQIENVLQINGKEATSAEKDAYEGRFIFDDVVLANDAEKDGMRNRRVMIACKVGLVVNPSLATSLTAKSWGKDIIGKQAIITTERQEWVDSVTDEKKHTVKVSFDGYENASGAAKAADKFDDI